MTGALSHKRVLITGGASGIGRETADLLAMEGASVAIGDIDLDGALATAADINLAAQRGEIDGRAVAFRCDVTDEAAIAGFVLQTVHQLGGIDVAIFNAGLQVSGMTELASAEDWDRVMSTNARQCFLGVKHVSPFMRHNPAGSIIFTASLAALKGQPGLAAYAASKGAIVALAKSLAVEMAPWGIRVNALCPGWTDTGFNKPILTYMGRTLLAASAAMTPLERAATPSEIAKAMLFLASDHSSYMTGQALVIDGGASA